jgi:hypothetical protein
MKKLKMTKVGLRSSTPARYCLGEKERQPFPVFSWESLDDWRIARKQGKQKKGGYWLALFRVSVSFVL